VEGNPLIKRGGYWQTNEKFELTASDLVQLTQIVWLCNLWISAHDTNTHCRIYEAEYYWFCFAQNEIISKQSWTASNAVMNDDKLIIAATIGPFISVECVIISGVQQW